MGVYVAGGVSGAHLNPAVTLAAGRAPRLPLEQGAALRRRAGRGRVHRRRRGRPRPTARPSTTSTAACARSRAPKGTAGIFATYPQDFLSTRRRPRRPGGGHGAPGRADLRPHRPAEPRAPEAGWARSSSAGSWSLIGMTFGFNAGYAINPARDLGPAPLHRSSAGWGGEVFRAGNDWWWVPIVGPLVGGVARRLALRPVHHAPPSARARRRRRHERALRPRPRPGHDLQPRDRLRPRRPRGGVRAAGVPADLPRARARRARPGGDLVVAARGRARGPGQGRRSAAADVAAIGITNQRETTILWDRHTGKPVANAIVWQSRVSAPICERAEGRTATRRCSAAAPAWSWTPTSPGTKIKHLLDTIPGLRARAEKGDVLFGTVDTFLIWRLTGGRAHVTDASNASRTLMFNIHTLRLGRRAAAHPRTCRGRMLPEVRESSSEVYGETDAELFGGADPRRGRGRRPAGGHLRPGLLRARQRQEHLRHRLLHAPQHRPQAAWPPRTACSPRSAGSSAAR